jgi:DHA1 family bicyclomycin/chloramphenicol resistance-like MFS transporter
MHGIPKILFLIFAAFLSFIGMFASDMYLPMLSQIQDSYNTTEALVGLSVSIYMVGFAFAQLFYGPLSDQIGRKLALILGLLLFASGTFGCIFATNIEVFLGFRFVQAIGVSAAYVLWQPMIVDLFEGEEVQRIFSMLVTLNAVSPAIAPLIGGYVGITMGWQAVFWLLQGVTFLILFWTVFVYKESIQKESLLKSFSVFNVISSYNKLFTNSIFIAFSSVVALSGTLYFVYLAIIPFILHNIGFSATEIGLACLPFALSFMTGAQVARKLHPELGDIRVMNLGVSGAVIGSFGLLLVSILSPSNAWLLIGSFSLVTFSNGFIIPIGMAFIIQRHSEIAGTCASAIGFLLSFIAFISTAIASFLVKPLGIYSISIVMVGFCGIMVIMFVKGKNLLRTEMLVRVITPTEV